MSEITGIKKYVIGTSGGVDSSLVICLLERALGKNSKPLRGVTIAFGY